MRGRVASVESVEDGYKLGGTRRGRGGREAGVWGDEGEERASLALYESSTATRVPPLLTDNTCLCSPVWHSSAFSASEHGRTLPVACARLRGFPKRCRRTAFRRLSSLDTPPGPTPLCLSLGPSICISKSFVNARIRPACRPNGNASSCRRLLFGTASSSVVQQILIVAARFARLPNLVSIFCRKL